MMLPAGEQFVLRTTTRVYDQAKASTCCAHAVAAALETRMVMANGLDVGELLVDPQGIFAKGRDQQSLAVSCQVVAAGIETPRGMERASTEPVAQDADDMAYYIRHEMPLMIEIQVGSNFGGHRGSLIYRSEGPRTPHAVCVIGYGTDADTQEPYWVIKNSYGVQWGDHGLGRIAWRDKATAPESYAITMTKVEP
jgi:hypothetical protein